MSAKEYLVLGALVIGLPAIYWVVLQWYKPNFEMQKNQMRKQLKTIPEIAVIILSEAALLKLWFEYQSNLLTDFMFALLYVVLIIMTILCVTDYWEKIVPNRILLLLTLVCFVIVGLQAIKDINIFIRMIPGMILGVIFCAISFGAAYMLSHGSLGSGDVKLAFLLGIFLTGEYVVGTVFYGCLISALYSVFQLWRKKLTRKDEIPFVPFLYLGLIITCFVR